MITYYLVYSFHAKSFEKELNQAIKDGWIKNEPMTMSKTNGAVVYCQLLFKQEEPKK